jgi:hypothetical protein
MAFGVHLVVPSLSGVTFITSKPTPTYHFGHKDGRHEALILLTS